jgi:hypothetical protein
MRRRGQTIKTPNPVTTPGRPSPRRPVAPIGVPTTGFGAAPPPYASNPNAPTYSPLPPYVAPTWTGGDYVAPTDGGPQRLAGVSGAPGSVLQGAQSVAAAQGTVLNGGTLKALDRDAQDYASNEYQNLRANTLEAYKQRYAQFSDAAGRGSRLAHGQRERQPEHVRQSHGDLQHGQRALAERLHDQRHERSAIASLITGTGCRT